MLDLRDRDEPALVVPEDQRRPRIGAEIDLPRHHLLHGEITGGYPEFLELQPALFEETGAQQIVCRHTPKVTLVALPDDGLGERGARREGCGGERQACGEVAPASYVGMRHSC